MRRSAGRCKVRARLRWLRRRTPHAGDTWHLDEVFIKVNGEWLYLWRAFVQDRAVLDILVQSRGDTKAAKRFFRTLLSVLRMETPPYGDASVWRRLSNAMTGRRLGMELVSVYSRGGRPQGKSGLSVRFLAHPWEPADDHVVAKFMTGVRQMRGWIVEVRCPRCRYNYGQFPAR
jgi:hypothetical protein